MAHAQNSGRIDPRIITILAILAIVGLRVWRLDLPFVEPYNSVARQSIVASVARNFYEHGFNFFYPEIDENGRGPYLYNAEMPFGPYLMAMGYKLAGGVKEGVARSVSVLFSLGTLFLLYLLMRRLTDKTFAFAATLFAGLSPLFLALSRSVQPEASFLLGQVGAVYFFQRYLESGRARFFWISALFLSWAVAAKFFNASLLILIAFMAWRVRGNSVFKDPKNILYTLVVCIPFLWYWRMWTLGLEMPLAYYPYRYLGHAAGAATSGVEHFQFWPSLWMCLKIFFGHILTPVGSVFFLLGLFRKPTTEAARLMLVWFLVALLTLVVGWKTVIQHSYYQVPLVLPAAYFVARGFRWFVDTGHSLARNKVVGFALLAAGILSLFPLYRGLYAVPDRKMAIVRAGHETDRLIPKDALLLASHETSPIQLYYAHRRGWSFPLIGRSTPELVSELEQRRGEGAEFFLATALWDLKKETSFERYLRERYAVIKEDFEFVLFDLRK